MPSTKPRLKKSDRRETPVSTLAVQIVQEAVRPDVAVGDLAKLAETDPGFAMRLLSVVNSAAYGLQTKVNDVRQAASLLGIAGLRNLALSLSISQMVPMGEDGEVLLANSLRRAVTSRLIAERLKEKRTDDHFTVGLLLEVGLLAQASYDLKGAADIARTPAFARPIQERAQGLVPHPNRGGEVAKQWNLSDETIAAITQHHDDALPDNKLAAVAWLSERVASVFEGTDIEASRELASRAFTQLGLGSDDLEQIIDQLPQLVLGAASGFQRSVGQQPNIDDLLRNANARLVDLNRNYQSLIRRLEKLLAEKAELAAQLEQANERLSRIAATDGLTGLNNHRTFQDALKRDLHRASRSGQPLSLVMLDVDHFKKFNDNFGHQAGDAVLRALGKLLRAAVRTGDVAARYGGEEFAVLLPDTDISGASMLAERLRRSVEKMRIKAGDRVLRITVSLGVATIGGRDCAEQASTLIRQADTALYQAKEAGRNRVVLSD